MCRENSTCKSGKMIKEFDTKFEADQAALYASQTYRDKTVSYQCEKCGNWHLAPAARVTPHTHCSFCNKDLYTSKAIADKRAKIIKDERGVQLYVYACPSGDGFHLTKRRVYS